MLKKPQIWILAIETSADETSAAVLTGNRKTGQFKLESNIIHSQLKTHRKTGGIVPEVAARAHIPKILPVIRQALAVAGAHLRQLDALAVTTGPGLITSLMIGVDTAKTLAFALNKPIIPINHLEGHLLSSFGNSPFPSFPKRGDGGEFFPAVGLIVSGGHTTLVLVKQIGRYKILGQTLDDAAGECFDKVAKLLGLPYPGGPVISRLAQSGNPKAFDFPRPMIDQKNYNFSFAGLKTAVLYFLRDNSPSPPLKLRGGRGALWKADIAASVEQAIIDVLVEKTLRAAKEFKVKAVLLGGGVAANSKLRQTLKKQIRKQLQNTKYYIPDTVLTGDNAGMIAIAGFYHYINGHVATFAKLKADPNLPLKSWLP